MRWGISAVFRASHLVGGAGALRETDARGAARRRATSVYGPDALPHHGAPVRRLRRQRHVAGRRSFRCARTPTRWRPRSPTCTRLRIDLRGLVASRAGVVIAGWPVDDLAALRLAVDDDLRATGLPLRGPEAVRLRDSAHASLAIFGGDVRRSRRAVGLRRPPPRHRVRPLHLRRARDRRLSPHAPHGVARRVRRPPLRSRPVMRRAIVLLATLAASTAATPPCRATATSRGVPHQRDRVHRPPRRDRAGAAHRSVGPQARVDAARRGLAGVAHRARPVRGPPLLRALGRRLVGRRLGGLGQPVEHADARRIDDHDAARRAARRRSACVEAGRSIGQKLSQAATAIALERDWKKDEILEAYLNLVGYRGEIVGVAALSATLFEKYPSGLDAREAAITAALVRAPNAAPARVAERACAILAPSRCPTSVAGSPSTPRSCSHARRRRGSTATRNSRRSSRARVLRERRRTSTDPRQPATVATTLDARAAALRPRHAAHASGRARRPQRRGRRGRRARQRERRGARLGRLVGRRCPTRRRSTTCSRRARPARRSSRSSTSSRSRSAG